MSAGNSALIFYSYSHRDERQRAKLQTHLSILHRRHVIRQWHDRMIGAGNEWRGQISKYLEEADIILLLVSSNFLASDYCYDVEMKRALERHEAGEAQVIPIILSYVDWQGAPFGHLQALPTDARPVAARGWKNQDEAWTNVAQGIRRAVEEFMTNHGVTALHHGTPLTPGNIQVQPTDDPSQRLKDEQIARLSDQFAEMRGAVQVLEARVTKLQDLVSEAQFRELIRLATAALPSGPLGPILSSTLIVPKTGARLCGLQPQMFGLEDGRLQFTNQQQQDAPVVVVFTFRLGAVQEMQGDYILSQAGGQFSLQAVPVSGRTVRQMLEMYDVLRSLREQQPFFLQDDVTGAIHLIMEGSLSYILDPNEERFVEALQVIQDAYPSERLLFPNSMTPSEAKRIFEVANIIRTGTLERTIDSATITLDAEAVGGFLAHIPQDGIIRGLEPREYGTIIQLLGVTLELGEVRTTVCPVRLARSPEELLADARQRAPKDGIPILLLPADAGNRQVVERYMHFPRRDEQT